MATSLYWDFHGDGLESFGQNGQPSQRTTPEPGAGAVLARVDAVTICSSDVKMIRLGKDYPLFRGRDFSRAPAVLGHELSLTVIEPGEGMEKDWRAGMRLCVQPDVYLHGERFCIGVNVEGGMAEAMLLQREVFVSDEGSTAFAVPNERSYAEVAQLEPIACVEASYRDWTRHEFKRDGLLLIVAAQDASGDYQLEPGLWHERVTLVGSAFALPANALPQGAEVLKSVAEALEKHGASSFDDVLLLGNPPNEDVALAAQALASKGLFCWLPDRPPEPMARVDVAKLHYEKLAWCGSANRSLAEALRPQRVRYGYHAGGVMLIMGGAGSMGRIHTLRALQDKNGPRRVVVTGRTSERLECLARDFDGIAKANGRELVTVATKTCLQWESLLRSLCDANGYDDIVVCAPGAEPAEQAAPFLAPNGRIIYFAGTKYGSMTSAPIGNVAWYGASITASSGSTAEDQKRVLQSILNGSINPNANVAAIVGLRALPDALRAMAENHFAGKVVLYPQLHDLPLTPLSELRGLSDGLAAEVAAHGWSRQAERLLYHACDVKE